MKPEEREVWQALDGAFTLLAKPDLEGALRSARGANAAAALGLVALLEKAKKLHAQAFENLRKSPPQENVRLMWNKKELVGRVVRIDGVRAWVKMQNLELPVDVAALPHDLLVTAAGLEGSDPKVLADRATLLFALGDTEPALAVLKRLKKEDGGGWAEALEQRAALERLSKFEKGVAEVEARIKDIQPREALAQLDTLKREFRDLAEGEQKRRLEYLAARADSLRAIKRLKRAFAGEVVRADEDLSVEVRYDFTKGQDALKDFAGGGLKAEADGLRVKGNGWDVKFSTTGGVCYLPRFQPTKLRAEYLVSSSRHDIMLGAIGYAQVKLRWIDTGQILITHEPQFTGNVFTGAAWKHPDLNGTYRYVFERTPDSTRFLLEETEHAKQAAPKGGTEERSWTTRLESNADFKVKEFVVKGQVDPEWLKEKVERE
jgi:tetratricopeptide (TPR) repeat protein